MTAIEKQTIKALAESDMKVYVAARKFGCAVPTLNTRIANIKKRTGLSATKFYDLVKLLNGIKGEEI